MDRDLNVMKAIQEEKEKELAQQEMQPLNAEGKALAECKRFTFDVVDVPTDPLR